MYVKKKNTQHYRLLIVFLYAQKEKDVLKLIKFNGQIIDTSFLKFK